MDDPAVTGSHTLQHTSPSTESSVKDTIDSILISFVLAFIVRGFLVEPFVIPTGSMAPTLLGAHMRFSCDDCGYGFDVNFSGRQDGDDVNIPQRASDDLSLDSKGRRQSKVFAIHCPNCGYRVPRTSSQDPDNTATDPPVHYGDRILVLKYPYLLSPPRRWDVVVFKSPVEPRKHDYQQNYIKRLIGTPGETVMVLDGDIYVATVDKPVSELEARDFVVQPKPRSVQSALWRVVYDNDYHPRKLSRETQYPDGRPSGKHEPAWEQPWKPSPDQSGWDLSGGRVFRFDNPTGSARIEFDPQSNPTKHSLTDWLGYDVTKNQGAGPRDPADTYDWPSLAYTPEHNVSDVRLRVVYERQSGEGPLRLSLIKREHQFIAEITPTEARLLHASAGQTRVLAATPLTARGTQPMLLEFENVDYRVSLSVDGAELLHTTPAEYQPDVAQLLAEYSTRREAPKAEVSIAAEMQSCRLSHVSLWRDVYYTNTVPRAGGPDPLAWASPEAFPRGASVGRHGTSSLIRLGAGEFFVCGDNSHISYDGRYWPDPINLPGEQLEVAAGRVPERFLLGKAFFVYWPAGFRPLERAPAVIPNFGDMRFIH